jgi:hypothetical protein
VGWHDAPRAIQRVVWHHDFDDEPVVLWSQIGDDHFERRKVDEYRDGRLDYADENASTGSTLLGDQPVPSLDQINTDSEFSGTAITQFEFEQAWARSVDLCSRLDRRKLGAAGS